MYVRANPKENKKSKANKQTDKSAPGVLHVFPGPGLYDSFGIYYNYTKHEFFSILL